MTAEATRIALDAVRSAPTVLQALHRGPGLDIAAAADAAAGPAAESTAVWLLRRAMDDSTDQLTAAVATLALGSMATRNSARVLAGMLEDCAPHLRDHVIWALGRGPFIGSALTRLTESVVAGGFGGMLAQRTLQHWAVERPDAVRAALEARLSGCSDPDGRRTLVETVGLVPGAATDRVLRGVAVDDDEVTAARAAAVAALGDRGAPRRTADAPSFSQPRPIAQRAHDPEVAADLAATRQVLTSLAAGTGPLASVAVLSLADLDDLHAPAATERAGRGRRDDGSRSVAGEADPATGRPLTVGQLFLHADIDGELSHAGQGDTGGIATLLVQLGDALLDAQPAVHRVVTISRRPATDGIGDLTRLDQPGHHYLSIPLWGPNVPAAQAWPLRIATGRGLRRALRAAGGLDVLHLRMGDVATMVAAEVAAEADLPIVFTLAPDPNALVARRDADGVLTRANFGAADSIEHLLFRVRLLDELRSTASHLVLFPRPTLERDMRALMDLDVTAEADRVSVVAEGVSMAAIDAAVGRSSSTWSSCPALSELDDLLAKLPPARRHLPVAISVGRLTPVKGMVTLVQAWAGDRDVRERCNLLIVGGDLHAPTDDEQQQLDAIDAVLPLDEAAAHGLLVPGHRPNATVAAWLRAVREGRPGGCAPGGIYVSASLKEEFGIAILEAMATGLVVVAPDTGGPATYVEDGVTGILTQTGSPDRLAEAISKAMALAAAPDADARAARAESVVREHFGIGTMASALAGVYHQAAMAGDLRQEAVAAS